jgi:hypothetical protein
MKVTPKTAARCGCAAVVTGTGVMGYTFGHMVDKQQIDRDAFIAYWKNYGTPGWRLALWCLTYLGGLALFAFVVHRVDADGGFLIVSVVAAVAYLILYPYLTIRIVRTRFARFNRCPHCGDRFGQDASGAYSGPNPKFKHVIETERCGKCGEQVLADS